MAMLPQLNKPQGQHGNGLQRGARAETAVILKAILSCTDGREALGSVSPRPAVFFSLSNAHSSCSLQGPGCTKRSSVSQILPPTAARGPVPSILWRGTRRAYPVLKDECRAHWHDEVTDNTGTWFTGKTHYKTTINSPTTNLWHNSITCKKPGGPEYLLWMRSGFTPAWDRNQHQSERPQSGSKLGARSPLPQKGGALIPACSSHCRYSKLSVTVLFCHYSFTSICWSLKGLVLCCFLKLTVSAFIWLKERANNLWQPRDAYGPTSIHSQQQNNP